MQHNYRGYDIEVKPHVDGNIQVSLDKIVQCHQTSLDAAMRWIDLEMKKV